MIGLVQYRKMRGVAFLDFIPDTVAIFFDELKP